MHPTLRLGGCVDSKCCDRHNPKARAHRWTRWSPCDLRRLAARHDQALGRSSQGRSGGGRERWGVIDRRGLQALWAHSRGIYRLATRNSSVWIQWAKSDAPSAISAEGRAVARAETTYSHNGARDSPCFVLTSRTSERLSRGCRALIIEHNLSHC
jgi:hypothetical protein